MAEMAYHHHSMMVRPAEAALTFGSPETKITSPLVRMAFGMLCVVLRGSVCVCECEREGECEQSFTRNLGCLGD